MVEVRLPSDQDASGRSFGDEERKLLREDALRRPGQTGAELDTPQGSLPLSARREGR